MNPHASPADAGLTPPAATADAAPMSSLLTVYGTLRFPAGALARAALEGIAYQVADILTAMQRDAVHRRGHAELAHAMADVALATLREIGQVGTDRKSVV